MVVEIDVRGRQCPEPLKEVAQQIVGLAPGTEFKVLTDDLTCFLMVRRILSLNEVEITGVEDSGPIYVIYGRAPRLAGR